MTIVQLKAKKRPSNSPSSKRLRMEGEIPAIYYDKQHHTIPLKISQKDVDQFMKGPMGPVRLTLDNNEVLLVVAKEVQRDHLGKKAIHMTFEGIKEGETFHIHLPIKLDYDENCGWMKEKGIAELRISKLHVEVLPKEMPEAIHININNLQIGDQLTIEDLKIPGVKFLDNPHTEVVGIAFRQIIEEEPAVKETTDGLANPMSATKGESTGPTTLAPGKTDVKHEHKKDDHKKEDHKKEDRKSQKGD